MLDLRLSPTPGRARLSSDPSLANDLQALKSRFLSSLSIGSQAFDLDIDDLLANLEQLTYWPTDDVDVRWEAELLRVVETNVADAAVLRDELNRASTEPGPSETPLGGGWVEDLREFQKRDLAKLSRLTHGANFSVPGAGKTRTTLALFQRKRDAGVASRMLVVCPKSAYESWQNESSICFSPPIRVAVADGTLLPQCDVLLINYERLADARSSLIQWMLSHKTFLVLDEAHRMKLGAAGAWGATCLALGPYAAARLILTGTPAPNGAKDLENLFAFVWPGQGRAEVIRALAGNDLRRASTVLRPLFVRTTKSELALPDVVPKVKRIDLPPLHRELYDALIGQFSGSRPGHVGNIEAMGKVLLYLLMAATSPALLALGSSRHEPLPYRLPPLQARPNSTLAELMKDLPQFELSPKFKEVLAIVSANAKLGRKTLVWSTFVRNLKSLEALLKNFNPALVHGGSEDRDAQLARFRRDEDCYVLLSNPATLGEGVSLHHTCHDAVYVDRDFAAGRFLQSIDRIHRLGLPPKTETRVTILIAAGTIDEVVEQRLAGKLKFMGGILDDPAVLELGDLEEEPTLSAGMDSTDLALLQMHLRNHVST